MTQQSYGQTQGYTPMQPKKSNKKLIAALIAIIVVVVVVLMIVLLLLGGVDGRFVGEWEYTIGSETMNLKFMDDGTVAVGYNGEYMSSTGTWTAEGGKLCISGGTGYGSEKTCMKYTFSNNEQSLTLEDFPGVGTITFTKK